VGINRKQRLKQAHDIIAALSEFFPAAFTVYERRRPPLKVGIREDIAASLAGAITLAELRLALSHYCHALGYLLACKEGAPRIGLNGQVAGVVTADEAAHAQALVADLRCKRTARVASTGPVKAKPRGLSFADLKKVALARKAPS
jgi:ProP effector